MVYFKQDKKMCDIKKSYSFHSVIVPANHLVIVRCFINKGCTVTKLVFFSVLFIPIVNINNLTRVVGGGVMTLQ